MELNREQIIKALECCSDGGRCNDCPYDSDCFMPQWVIVKDALALIRELTEDNERLEDNLIKQSTENIMLLIERKDITADTVRKMQARLKACTECVGECSVDNPLAETYSVVREDTIDQIAKELLEEETGNG